MPEYIAPFEPIPTSPLKNPLVAIIFPDRVAPAAIKIPLPVICAPTEETKYAVPLTAPVFKDDKVIVFPLIDWTVVVPEIPFAKTYIPV